MFLIEDHIGFDFLYWYISQNNLFQLLQNYQYNLHSNYLQKFFYAIQNVISYHKSRVGSRRNDDSQLELYNLVSNQNYLTFLHLGQILTKTSHEKKLDALINVRNLIRYVYCTGEIENKLYYWSIILW